MATFKVGDKVRAIAAYGGAMNVHRIGRTGVIVGRFTYHESFPHLKYEWWVDLDDGRPFVCPSSHLAPLTDPLAEQFLERIRKLEREPMPLTKEHA